jgi:hypothetical protein
MGRAIKPYQIQRFRHRLVIVLTATALCGCAAMAGNTAARAGAPVDGPPTMRVAFPRIKDWNSLRITMHRSADAPYTIPKYGIEVDGDCTIIYQGNAFVAANREQRGKVPQKDVRYLYDLFRHADYFSLLDKYTAFPS